MHTVVVNSLEEYLSGTLAPAARRDIEVHLSACERCQEELSGMQNLSGLFSSLQCEETWEPAAGFHVRVMQRVGESKMVPALAGFFVLDLAFVRRLAFTSLLTLGILGSYLVMREGEYPTGPSPEAVMAQQDSPAFDSARAQDNMLVTMTTYEP